MNKKKLIIYCIIGLFLGMLVPVPIHYKDGGTVEYRAFLYSITKLHQLNLEEGYDEGTIVKIIGIDVYNTVKKSNLSLNELTTLNKDIQAKAKEIDDYTNYKYSYVDEIKRVIIVFLEEDTEETEEWFRKNVMDSECLVFKKYNPASFSILYMYIKNDTLSKTGATIIIEDIGDEKHQFDSSYLIERKVNNKWEKIEYLNVPNWNEESLIVNENGHIEQNLNWESYYGILEKGSYRIIKDVFIEKENKKEFIITEFNIFV